MNVSRIAGGLAAAVVLSSTSVAFAAAPKTVLPEAARMIEGGRSVQVLVAQSEIKSNINASNVTVATGGGLLGALIDAKIEADRAKRAEAAIQPLREALTGYDVDALAVETTKTSAAALAWLQPAAQSFGRDSSVLGKSSALDAGASNQTAFFEYVYDTSPDFSAMRVSVAIQFADKTVPNGKKPESRLDARNLAYTQTLTSVVKLPNASKDLNENAKRWAADGGALAKQALTIGFQDLARMAPQALQLTDADVKAMNGKEHQRVFEDGYAGRVQQDGADGKLLFTGGLVNIRTLAQ